MATARVPKEGQDANNAENIRLQKTGTGTVHKQIGDSLFYSKHGIKPITETLDNSELESPIKMKNVRKLHDGSTKFPKLAECAHFHYDFTDFGAIQVYLSQENQENVHKQGEGTDIDFVFFLCVTSIEKTWTIRRSHENFKIFDKQLHKCIFDRKFSLLPDLRRNDRDIAEHERIPALRKLLALYLKRFSAIAGNMINCGPILSWLEMDNRGNRLMVTDDSAINTPAVTAGHVIKRYIAQAPDEISLQVGDIISIIDMPPGEETGWWRGKQEYEVGFFPCECVELISEKSIRQSIESKIPESATRPVLRKRGKLISFLRAFFTTRPARTQLQRTGIMKQRIFGCDLGEHLLNSGLDVPSVLTNCTEVIEEHGIVDGIYRLSGVASNIQKLRNDFDEEKEPNLTDEIYLQDIHSISSLLKAYFRELPNPLLTYQLYEKFSEAVQVEESKLLMIHDVIQQLPPPHYRTAEFLFKHLQRVSKHGRQTGMHCKNLAIVWAPNLMRSKELETMCNTAMLQGVGLQAIVTEYLIQFADVIFSEKLQNIPGDGSVGRRARPKSLAISTPTKLLSLEEAREQMLSGTSNGSPKQRFIEVGGGPSNLPREYHTVIELPGKSKKRKDRKKSLPESSTASGPGDGTSITSGSAGVERSASGWRNIFSRKKQDSMKSNSSEARVAMKISDEHTHHTKLRTVRSADSLLSAANASSESKNERNSDPFNGQSSRISKSVKDEDFPVVKPKALTYERAGKTKYKSNRRTRSHDLTQSESDLSDQDSEIVAMETEYVQRPASATAELTGGRRSDLVTELEHTLSTKSTNKKVKSSKESKKAKKKQRSSSAGQPIEGIPMMVDDHERMIHSMPSGNTYHQPHFTDFNAPELPPPRQQQPQYQQQQQQHQHYHEHYQPPPSPSFKERLVQALTPTSPRKKIKGPAPSPPASPPPVVHNLPPQKSPNKTKKSSKSSISKSPKHSSSADVPDVISAQIQPHSKFELLTGKPENSVPVYALDHVQQQQQQLLLQNDPNNLQMVQLSPIEEALNSDMSTTPDTEQHGLVSKLKHNPLQEIELQGAEGAEAEMASVGGLTDEEVFQYDNFAAIITPDMENDSRKDALANLDIIHGSNYNAELVGGSMGRDGCNLHRLTDMGYGGGSGGDDVNVIDQNYYNTLQSETSAITDSTLCNTDMSMSLDSLLQQVVGTENYQSEFGSNASFRTFGKSAAVAAAPSNEAISSGSRTTISQIEVGNSGSVFDKDDNMTRSYQEHSHHSSSPSRHLSSKQYSGNNNQKSTTNSYVVNSPPPPVPKPRSSKTKSPKHVERSNELYAESTGSNEEESVVESCVRPADSILLETDIDAFSDATELKTPFDVNIEYPSAPVYGRNTGKLHSTTQSEDEDPDERRNYIAPLPGDIKMMSQYPDLIAPNLLAQIDLQETDVQYVDPHTINESHSSDEIIWGETRQPSYVGIDTGEIRQDDYDNNTEDGVSENDNLSTISQHYYQEHTHLPDVMPPIERQHELFMKSEPGRIVIRKPLDENSEGSTFIPVKTRVAAPPKQFAFSAESPANEYSLNHGCYNEQQQQESDDGETAIDTPSDEFPPPPALSDELESKQDIKPSITDGYMADRSTSTSPANNHIEKDQLKAASQPLTIEENEAGVEMMTISPPSSAAKTPDSDNAMITSSVESDNILDSMNKSAMSIDDKDHVYHPVSGSSVEEGCGKIATTPDGIERDMVFQMDDIRTKSSDSLHNISMSSDDPDLVVEDVREERDKDEFIIENTESQLNYFFTYGQNNEEEKSADIKPNEAYRWNNQMQELTVDTNTGTHNSDSADTVNRVEEVKSNIEHELVKNNESDDIEDETPGRKSSPVKRNKSVKELLSRFEVNTNSPPSDGESKVKPPIFQKPKIVRLHSLTKSEDFDDEEISSVPTTSRSNKSSEDEQYLMSKSCPEATRLLSLSPRSIDITNSDDQPQSVSYLESSNTDIEPRESNLNRKDRPSVRNKIKQFESSESLTSDSERTKSVSPGRKYTKSEVSPVGRAVSNSPKEKNVSPVPPAKPVIVHERKSSKSDIPMPSATTNKVPNTNPHSEAHSSLQGDSFPAAQKSQLPPSFSTNQQPLQHSNTPIRSSFQMRSASSGMSSNAISEVQSPDKSGNKPQSLLERKRRFESSRQDSSEYNSDSCSSSLPRTGSSTPDHDNSKSYSGGSSLPRTGSSTPDQNNSKSYYNRTLSVDSSNLQQHSRYNAPLDGSDQVISENTEEISLVSSSRNQIKSNDYDMSQSVPSTYDSFSSSSGKTQYAGYSVPIESSTHQLDDNESSSDLGILKSSGLFKQGRRSKKEPPPVPPHSNSSITRSSKTGASDHNEDSNIRASFSDRRKLFESSTDSGISSSSYGSVKRGGDSGGYGSIGKSKFSGNNSESLLSSNEVGTSDSFVSNSSQLSSPREVVTSSTNFDAKSSTNKDYANRARSYGQKTVVIEAKDSGYRNSNTSMTNNSSNDNIVSSSRNESIIQEQQKENVKPPVVFNKSFETKNSGQKERTGTVKDLWRKFEQHNT